jgi:hypothetical protein
MFCKMKLHQLILIAFCSFSIFLQAEETQINSPEKAAEASTVQFTPPPGWRYGDLPAMLPNVNIVVVGQGNREFPPSMHLGTEKYSGTLKEYLKIVKAINDAQGGEWKDLGTIQTDAGPASLSQLDTKTQWGDIRMMHVILLKNGMVYILTSAALKEEFPKFYKDFFKAMRSLRIDHGANSAKAS